MFRKSDKKYMFKRNKLRGKKKNCFDDGNKNKYSKVKREVKIRDKASIETNHNFNNTCISME